MTSTDRNFASTSEVQLLRLEAGRHDTHPVRSGDVFRFCFLPEPSGISALLHRWWLKESRLSGGRGGSCCPPFSDKPVLFLLPSSYTDAHIISFVNWNPSADHSWQEIYAFVSKGNFLKYPAILFPKLSQLWNGLPQFCPMGNIVPSEKKRSAFRSWAACPEPLWVPAPGMRRRWGVLTLAPRISVAPYGEAVVDQPLNIGKFWCGYNLGIIITNSVYIAIYTNYT